MKNKSGFYSQKEVIIILFKIEIMAQDYNQSEKQLLPNINIC